MQSHTEVVVVTVERLRELIREAVEAALTERTTTPQHDVMTAAQVAEMLGIHTKSLSKYVRSDNLPAIKVGTHYRFKREDVIAWLEERAVRPGAHTKHYERL